MLLLFSVAMQCHVNNNSGDAAALAQGDRRPITFADSLRMPGIISCRRGDQVKHLLKWRVYIYTNCKSPKINIHRVLVNLGVQCSS